MKKYGRKWHKIQKEKEFRRANTKVEAPFSKAINSTREQEPQTLAFSFPLFPPFPQFRNELKKFD